MIVLLTLEGNIGAGKSTLLEVLRRRHAAAADASYPRFSLEVVPEPIDMWCSPVLPGGQSMLDAYYGDPGRNALSFQMYAMLTRIEQMDRVLRATRASQASEASEASEASDIPDIRVVVTERDAWSGVELFGRPMHDSGLLTDADWHVYTAWRDATRRKWEAVRAPGIVYVRCGPEACERRIRRRGRHSEAHIERSYLELLHRTHEAYVASAECAVLRLDAETDTPETMADTFFDWIVSTFVKNSHK